MANAVITFLSLLTVAADVVVLAALVVWVGGRANERLGRLWSSTVEAFAPSALTLGFVVALVSLIGSLWLSEGAHFTPCTLCWYQRIAMYPLTPILGLAALRSDLAVRPYALSLVVLGFPISVYHYLLERFPALDAGACGTATPCTLVWIWRFHYISIPLMAGSAFALLALLLAVSKGGSIHELSPERPTAS